MDRRVTPSKRVTSPTWDPPPPYHKQALIREWLEHKLKLLISPHQFVPTGWFLASEHFSSEKKKEKENKNKKNQEPSNKGKLRLLGDKIRNKTLSVKVFTRTRLEMR